MRVRISGEVSTILSAELYFLNEGKWLKARNCTRCVDCDRVADAPRARHAAGTNSASLEREGWASGFLMVVAASRLMCDENIGRSDACCERKGHDCCARTLGR